MRVLIIVCASLLSAIAGRSQSLGLAVQAGTTGPGVEVTVPLSRSATFRVAGFYFRAHADRTLQRGAIAYGVDGALAAGAAAVHLDVRLAGRARISAGLFTVLGAGDMTLSPEGPVSLAGVHLEGNELGMVRVESHLPERPAPYLGLGFGGSGRRVSLVGDVGMVWTGSPEFRVEATGRLEGSQAWETVLSEAFDGGGFYPVARVGIMLKLRAPGSRGTP